MLKSSLLPSDLIVNWNTERPTPSRPSDTAQAAAAGAKTQHCFEEEVSDIPSVDQLSDFEKMVLQKLQAKQQEKQSTANHSTQSQSKTVVVSIDPNNIDQNKLHIPIYLRHHFLVKELFPLRLT